MLRLASVTPALGFAAAAAALVAAGSSTALGQSPAGPAQEPRRPPAVSAADDAALDRRHEPPPTIIRSLSLFDHGLTTSKTSPLVVESWRSRVEMRCLGCRGFETTSVWPESTNANAPWALQGRWRRQTTIGLVSTGFVGVRNYALPLATAVRLGGDLDPTVLRNSGSSAFLPGSQWSLTAAIEKALATSANGTSFGVTADVLIPVKNDTPAVGERGNTGLSSTTTRVGTFLRW